MSTLRRRARTMRCNRNPLPLVGTKSDECSVGSHKPASPSSISSRKTKEKFQLVFFEILE